MTTVDNLSQLPPDMIQQVALSLPLPDLATFCRTSAGLARLCQSESFWHRKLERDFPLVARAIPTLGLTNFSYQELYQGHASFFSPIGTPTEKEVYANSLVLVRPVPPYDIYHNQDWFFQKNEYWMVPDAIFMWSANYARIAERNRDNVLGQFPMLTDGLNYSDDNNTSIMSNTDLPKPVINTKFDTYRYIDPDNFNTVINKINEMGYMKLNYNGTNLFLDESSGNLNYGEIFVEAYPEFFRPTTEYFGKLFNRMDFIAPQIYPVKQSNTEKVYGQKPYRVGSVTDERRPVKRSPRRK